MPFRIVPPVGPRAPIVAHVPHASTTVPDEYRRQILLDDAALAQELLRMTDWHTDRLFAGVRKLGATQFVNELSRLVVDPEQFADDAHEPGAAAGQGAVYTRTSDRAELRRLSESEREALIDRVYLPYHQALTELVSGVLDEFGRCLILDCHSFGSVPLPSEADQRPDRPEICIGTDAFHTPAALSDAFVSAFRGEGFSVEKDRPFTGALVPLRWYATDPRVSAVMVEVRRDVYCDEATGEPLSQFDEVRAAVSRAISTAIDA